MKLAFVQAGSILGDWFTSCLSCLSPAQEDERYRHQEALKRKGVEREMKICHNQPHLVPPMRLVLYDDMPSPTVPPRTASLPSWVIEGKNRMSRASSRAASLSTRRKSRAATRLRISSPTDFRRVNPPAARSAAYRPLELSIYTPGNRLSDLPTFESFDIEDEHQLLTPPAKVFSPILDRPQQSSSLQYRLRRKPVGSGSNRTSLANQEMLQTDYSITSPLIPHFSTRIPSFSMGIREAFSHGSAITVDPGTVPHAAANEIQEGMPMSEHLSGPDAPTSSALHDRPLPPLPVSEDDIFSQDRPTTPPTAPRSLPHSPGDCNSVSQWLLSSSPSSSSESNSKTTTSSSTTTTSSPHDHKASTLSRSRTLSDTTTVSSEMTCVTSTTTTTTTNKPTPSLSSAITTLTSTTVQTWSMLADPLRAEKEYELAMSEYPVSFPTDKYCHGATIEKYKRRQPTTPQEVSGQGQGQGEEEHDEENYLDEKGEMANDDLAYSDYAMQERRSVVGLAY